MSIHNDAAALAKRAPTISKADCEAISKAARAELRDRFAMAALTGLLANPFLLETMSEIMKKHGDKFPENYRNFTELADFHADAMMKARGK
jgi:hypothetical protein